MKTKLQPVLDALETVMSEGSIEHVLGTDGVDKVTKAIAIVKGLMAMEPVGYLVSRAMCEPYLHSSTGQRGVGQHPTIHIQGHTMTTDRELLEGAARASGYEAVFNMADACQLHDTNGYVCFWNPLTDDSDALRLAVKLGLAVTPYPIYGDKKHSVLVQLRTMDESRFEVMELNRTDPYTATRRAITRAAYEISKGMK